MLKVFVVGLIYFDGCDEPEMSAWVPDGRAGQYTAVPHNASLWIRADQVDMSATQWPGDLTPRLVKGVPTIEFRIDTDLVLEFPDQGDPLTCSALDAVMPKLEKKDKKKDGDLEPFEIDRVNAVTIARVPIRGGELVPYLITNKNRSGLVEWTIPSSSGGLITAGSNHNIRLAAGNVEVVLSNKHQIPLDANQDHLRNDDHIQLFKQLIAPELRDTTTLIAHKPGKLDKVETSDAFVAFLDQVNYTCGVTPPCCCARVSHA